MKRIASLVLSACLLLGGLAHAGAAYAVPDVPDALFWDVPADAQEPETGGPASSVPEAADGDSGASSDEPDDDEGGPLGEEAYDAEQPVDELDEQPEPARAPSVRYDVRSQRTGWQILAQGRVDERDGWFSDGETAGSTGFALYLEALRMALDSQLDGGISYQVHVRNYAWLPVVSDGQNACEGIYGHRIEALRVWLTGEIAQSYSVYYRVHVQNYGWLDWACDGQVSGTFAMSLRAEAVEVRLVPAGEAAPGSMERPSVSGFGSMLTHVQNVGWQRCADVKVGTVTTIGTVGRALRLEGLRVSSSVSDVVGGTFVYNAHVQNIGWQRDVDDEDSWFSGGEMAGTQGRSLAMEAVQIDITGELDELYDLYCRAHVQDLGWLGWAPAGQAIGTIGMCRRLEAIQLLLVPKDGEAPEMDSQAFYGAPPLVATVRAGGSSVSIRSTTVGTDSYLFLPACADLSELRLGTGDGSGAVRVSLPGNADSFGWSSSDMPVDASAAPVDEGSDVSARLLLAQTEPVYAPTFVHVVRSESVSSLFLTSDDPVGAGRAFVDGSPDHSAKATGSMALLGADGSVAYDGGLTQIKGRGNTTWRNSSKKPYQIKLAKKADLLSTGRKENAAKTWVLLANAFDPTLLANTVGYDLGRELELVGMECAPIDLWYDGEYRGSYLLCEKVQINKGRVDIHDLEADFEDTNADVDLAKLPRKRSFNSFGMEYQFIESVMNPSDISGGYLLELDYHWYRKEACWFQSSAGPVVVKSPEYCSAIAMRYISEQFEGAWRAMRTAEVPAPTISARMDLPSLAKTILVNGLEKNPDTLQSSTYFYKNRGSDLICSGPIWDLDRGLGVSYVPTVTAYGNGRSERLLGESAQLRAAVKAEWGLFSRVTRDILLGNGIVGGSALNSFDAYVDRIAVSQSLNQLLWGLTWNESIYERNPLFTEYADLAVHTKGWISSRLDWMDSVVATY